MHKLKMQIEGQLQEIVFYMSVLLAFSVFLSGIFSLVLTPESLVYILGNFGSTINQALITGFGFAFFYFAVVALHMGYVINMNVFSFKDFKREHQLLSITAVAHILILFCLASLLSAVQVALQMSNGEVLTGGTGGLVGQTFGRFLHAHLGLYGSSLILTAVAFGISIVSGFYEISDVVKFAKDVLAGTKHALVSLLHGIHAFMNTLAALILRDQRLATVNVGYMSSRGWISSTLDKAQAFVIDRLPFRSAPTEKKGIRKAKVTAKAKTTKKPAVNKAPAKVEKTVAPRAATALAAPKTATALKASVAKKTAAVKPKKRATSKK